MTRLLTNIKKVAVATLNKAMEIDIFTQAAAIAFYTIFSIAPLFILIVSVASFFVSEEMITEQIQLQLNEAIGEDISNNLIQFVSGQTDQPSSFWASILAGVIMIFGATTVVSQLKYALNRIWNVEEFTISSIGIFFLGRVISFAIVLLLSLLLLISLLAEGAVAMISSFFDHLLPTIPLDLYFYLTVISSNLIAMISFMLIFKILPDVKARWRDLAVGALVTTLLFILGKYLIGFYLSTTGDTYRAAGTMIVFVVWVYYNILIILLGAIFTQVYTSMFGGEIKPYSFVEISSQEPVNQ